VFFEEASKVPFIISYKGINPGKSDYLVQTGIDLMPTLLEFAGIPLNENIRGKSVKKIITDGSSSADREYIVVSDRLVQGDTVNGYKPEPEGRMLRDKRFKYWIYNEGVMRETLFDLGNDPGEMINLASDQKYKSDLENCRRLLLGWAEKYNDPFMKYMIK
jgi:arylsulfatase A-like enzyme